jgi:hypothetical protein
MGGLTTAAMNICARPSIDSLPLFAQQAVRVPVTVDNFIRVVPQSPCRDTAAHRVQRLGQLAGTHRKLRPSRDGAAPGHIPRPLTVGTPRLLGSIAIPYHDVIPARRNSATIGANWAARASARAIWTSRPVSPVLDLPVSSMASRGKEKLARRGRGEPDDDDRTHPAFNANKFRVSAAFRRSSAELWDNFAPLGGAPKIITTSCA